MEFEAPVQAQNTVCSFYHKTIFVGWVVFPRLRNEHFPDVDPFMDYVQHSTPPDAIPTPELKSPARFLL